MALAPDEVAASNSRLSWFSTTIGINVRFLAAILLSVSAQAIADPLGGEWASPLGKLSLSQHGDAVTGSLIVPAGTCALPSKSQVLKGDLLEDSLSGQIQVCLTGCASAVAWVPVLLLVSPDGHVLSGTTTLPKGCAAPLGRNGSLSLRRISVEATPAHVAARRPPPPVEHSPPRENQEARAQAEVIARDGEAFQKEGKFESARERFLEAVRIDPLYGEGYNGIGVTFYARNDFKEALRWYKKALAADPGLGDAYYNMACIYALQHDKSLSLRYLRTALRNGFTSRDQMREDSDLASLRPDPQFQALTRRGQPMRAATPQRNVIGRYDIHERIGRGGMCDVFKALVRSGSREGETVVIKRLSREMAESHEAVEMFVGEADVSRLLKHRNIIEVFETGQASGESSGGYYIAMEFVDGKDLGAILDRCRTRDILLPVDFSVFLVSQLLDALEYAHNARGPSGRRLGIVHCDVSPGNVFISRLGEIKLGDFGIARVRALESHGQDREAGVWGKPYYLAPEALRGESPTPATDLWASAVILYELLTDKRPFHGHTLDELSAAIELARPDSPGDLRPGLPSALAEVVLTALDYERLRRYGTAREFRSALVTVLR